MKNLILTFTLLFTSFIAFAGFEKEYPVSDFSSIRFDGNGRCVLIPSDAPRVVAGSSNEEVFDYLDIKTEGGMLHLDVTSKSKNVGKLFSTLTISVYYVKIDAIEMRGAGTLRTEGPVVNPFINCTLRGTGNMEVAIDAKSFEGNMYGTGTLKIMGNAKNSVVSVEGVGSFQGGDLKTENTDVTVSGVGKAHVHVTGVLHATLNGVGSIRYSGAPRTKNLDKNGLGSIKPL